MLKIFLLVLFCVRILYSQTDWVKWESKNVSYELTKNVVQKTNSANTGLTSKFVSSARMVYKVLFSDLDGDNCPFNPTCSQFYVDAVKETNLIQGTLMFSDRFIRDLNFFKGLNNYQKIEPNKFYDPAVNYSNNSDKILLSLPEIISE